MLPSTDRAACERVGTCIDRPGGWVCVDVAPAHGTCESCLNAGVPVCRKGRLSIPLEKHVHGQLW